MATSRQKNALKKILTQLRKKIQGKPSFRKRPVLEELIFQILSDDRHAKEANACINALKSNFVDWNEARVSERRELSNLFDEEKLPNAYDKAKLFKEMMNSVFIQERHFTFDMLNAEGNTPEKTRRFLLNLNQVTPRIAANVMARSLDLPAFPLDMGMLRLLRAGKIVPVTETLIKAQKIMEEILKPTEFQEAYFLISSFTDTASQEDVEWFLHGIGLHKKPAPKKVPKPPKAPKPAKAAKTPVKEPAGKPAPRKKK